MRKKQSFPQALQVLLNIDSLDYHDRINHGVENRHFLVVFRFPSWRAAKMIAVKRQVQPNT